ncbi:MAG: AgmX/PglI C-terminal domain-containing protein, partial [Polyangiaceae bacterium]|nr:AgmX/PglI C-terminal domain-containing protein [Polyangiaceae bacterium]
EQPVAAPPPPPPPGQLPPVAVQLIVRRNFGRFRACYIDAVRQKPGSKGRVVVNFRIDPNGSVGLARIDQSEIPHPPFVACLVRSFEALEFPESPGGPVSVTYPLAFGPADGTAPLERPMKGLGVGGFVPPAGPAAAPPPQPWLGDVELVEKAIERADSATALRIAERARVEDPLSPLSYIATADALTAAGRADDAARANASIADLAPNDPASLRMAAFRSLAFPEARTAAEDWLHRSLSVDAASLDAPRIVAELYALRGNIDGALQILDGLLGATPSSRATASTREILRGDIALVAAALAARDGSRRAELERWAAAVGAVLPEKAVFLAAAVGHEAGADLDLIVADISEARATRATPHLATGGKLATTVGPGPEAFISDGRRAYPYDLEVVLTQRDGAFSSGAVSILEHDGRGGLHMIALPFVIQVEKARVNAGRLEEPTR